MKRRRAHKDEIVTAIHALQIVMRFAPRVEERLRCSALIRDVYAAHGVLEGLAVRVRTLLQDGRRCVPTKAGQKAIDAACAVALQFEQDASVQLDLDLRAAE